MNSVSTRRNLFCGSYCHKLVRISIKRNIVRAVVYKRGFFDVIERILDQVMTGLI